MYTIDYTNTTKTSIKIPDNSLVSSVVDIVLIGQSAEEYGLEFDENVLHLLENFASFESTLNPGTPDLTKVIPPLLQQPTEGQLWFNKTESQLYVYTAPKWVSLAVRNDISGNNGIIAHGQQLPLPSSVTSYAECSWFVTPLYIDELVNYLECYTDSNATVSMRYRPSGSSQLIDGMASYMIFGQKNSAHSVSFPLPSVPAQPSPTLTPTLTPTVTPTNTPAAGVTVTPTVSTTFSVTPTSTLTVTPTSTVTPTPTLTITPTITPSSYVTSYILFAQSYDNGIIYNVGYNNLSMGVPTYGTLTPSTYFGYFVHSFFQYTASGVQTNTTLVLGLTSPNGGPAASSTAVASVKFIDNTGTLQTFTLAQATVNNSVYNGNNLTTWTWNTGNTLFFYPNSNYIVLISEQ